MTGREYSLQEKWDAIGKHMLAHGMENADLGEKLGGLHKDTIRKARNGTKPVTNPAIMDRIPPLFGASGYDGLIRQANAMPEMSPEKVMEAIYRTAAHKKMQLKEVVERSGYTSKLFSQPAIGTKAAHAVATKSFGFNSTAEMIEFANLLPEAPRRAARLERKIISDQGNMANDEVLIALVRKLQHEHRWTDTQMTIALNISRSQYMTTIQRGRFQSDEERNKLPGIFGFDSMQDMLSGAAPSQQPAAPPKRKTGNDSPSHWRHLLNQEKMSKFLGNPHNGWERD